MKKFILASAIVSVLSVAAFAAETGPKDVKSVWGGGSIESSAYSGVYVPHLIKVLEGARLAGYHWGGTTDGTLENAEIITDNPTNLAVGQLDILKSIQNQPIPDASGKTYQFTILAEDMGPECLVMVTAEKNYTTLGDVIGNSWDLSLVTGGEKSGSFGTWKVLSGIYPDLAEVAVTHEGDNIKLVNTVAKTPGTFGFFVMRPDPNSKVFEEIDRLGLSIVPVVDFELDGRYVVNELKVAHGGLLSSAKTLTTSCTSVALITGDLASTALASENAKKRLTATIDRVKKIDPGALKPNTDSWRDMFDSIRTVASGKAKEMMEKSKTALDGLIKKGQAG